MSFYEGIGLFVTIFFSGATVLLVGYAIVNRLVAGLKWIDDHLGDRATFVAVLLLSSFIVGLVFTVVEAIRMSE